MIDEPVIIAIFVATLCGLALIGLLVGRFTSKDAKRLNRRLLRIAGADSKTSTAAALNIRLKEPNSSIPALDQLVQRFMPRRQALQIRLERTGRRIAPGEYLMATVGIALVAGLALRVAVGLPPAIALLVGAAIGFGLPHVAVSRMIKRRIKAFTAQFPEAIDLIVRGLRSGLPVPVSMGTVAAEMSEPISGQFRGITERLAVGQQMDEALGDAAERLPTPEFRFFVICLAIQRETGGNLAETLENLADLLRKRRQMRLKIKALSSEAKASAYILGSLPFILFGLLFLINPAYVTRLFVDPRGLVMLGFGLGSLTVGVLVMAKMVRFEI